MQPDGSLGRLRWIVLVSIFTICQCQSNGSSLLHSSNASKIFSSMLGAAPLPPAPPPLASLGYPGGAGLPVTVAPPPVVPNPPACTTDLSTLIYLITAMAKYITWSTQYCAQPNEVSTICANYVIGIIGKTLSITTTLASTVFTCGNVQAVCTEVIAGAIKGVVSAVQLTVKMEITCFDDVLCSYMAVRFVSALLHAAKNIETAIFTCPVDDGDDGDDVQSDGENGDADGDGDGRRMLEVDYFPALRHPFHRGILLPSAHGLE